MSQRLLTPPGSAFVAKLPQNLPQTATASLYTVTGGSVLVVGMLGVVTTVIGATATTLALGATAGSTAIATATAITASPVGTWLAPVNSSGKGGALNVAGAAFVAAPPFIVNPFVVGSPGTTGAITWTTSASTTGQVQWYLWYVPLDFDATVS